MIYSDENIEAAIALKELVFIPSLSKDQIGPASIDLKLGPVFKKYNNKKVKCLDLKKTKLTDKDFIISNHTNNSCYVLEPQEFILACTKEYVKVPSHLLLRMEGKSTLARMGLMIHTAGFIDPGFEGTLTLEISNHSNIPIVLYPDMYICQVAVEELRTPSATPYNKRKKSLYSRSKKPGQPNINNLFEKK